MKIQDWLKSTVKKLEEKNNPTARLDALVLLEDALSKDRGWILAHPDEEISDDVLEKLELYVTRRIGHEPLAYIRGKSEFYGRKFIVTPATLQPRPETEVMIELFKMLPLSADSAVIDIGTGSGAIIITAKCERPDITAYATDVQSDALLIAGQNAVKHKTDITFREGTLLEPFISTNIDIILTNLPYVPDDYEINQAATHEPSVALFGGEDGLDLYRDLFSQITNMEESHRPTYILTESLPLQHNTLREIAQSNGYYIEKSQDFIQVFKQIIR